MHLIATDEAGYGPKLGPLVVASTRWSLPKANKPTDDELQSLFKPIREGGTVGGTAFVIDDSKAVYKPQSAGPDGGNLTVLALPAVIAYQWTCRQVQPNLLAAFAPCDIDEIRKSDWLKSAETDNDQFPEAEISRLIENWQACDANLGNVKARVITASRFNQQIASGFNKADILSSTTLGLIKQQLDELPDDHQPICVFCDRHGGRQYYASVLQSVFDGTLVSVISESKQMSAYKLPYRDRELTIRFTVKGDRFTPVAYSSLVAKYIRERMMQSFNRYFAELHKRYNEGDVSLRPTAGYPVDADRFLKDVEHLIRLTELDRDALIRAR